jgi:Na+-translocating ferredoxin:NAD+ oxidoreductase RnfD subunit
MLTLGSVVDIKRTALVVVGTAAYLALAVLGWGGLAAFFFHPALIALAVEVSSWLVRRCSRGCCEPSLAQNTIPTAPARRD